MPKDKFNVAVLGAAGGIGQPLSLLMKLSEYVSTLVLYDVVPVVHGVAADLSHVETGAEVLSFCGPLNDKEEQAVQARRALEGVDVVIIPAGVPRKPGMTRDDLFNINAGIVKGLVEAVADACPEAYLCIISNPVNSTVPIAAEVLKKRAVYNQNKLFGVSTLDVVRANTFVAQKLAEKDATVSVADIKVKVIGGHSGVTIIPLLSMFNLSEDEIDTLTTRIQNAGTEVVEAKQGAGSATLSMAYAGSRFAVSLMKALSGQKDVVECAYIETNIRPEVSFFATSIKLGENGIEKVLPLENLSAKEEEKVKKEVIPALKQAIDKGLAFVAK
eukprot:snap_masked-scaffold_1-processed-gene-32.9-mRNA-1 protein AED:0.02 eAED:0.02 QI:134/1/1/1/1/1/3/42/329